MVFILLNKENKRIRLKDGTLTPAFDFASEAYDYGESRGMFYYKIRKV